MFWIIPFLALTSLLNGLTVRPAWAGEERPGWQLRWEQTVKEAKREGKLVIYHGSDLLYEKVFSEFHKRHPEVGIVTVSGASGPGGISQRIMTEQRAGKYLGDVYTLGATTAYTVLYKGNAFDPIKPALILPEVLDETKWLDGRHRYVDGEGQYIFSFNGELQPYFGYNTKVVNPSEVKSYWDFLNPKWKGRMVALDPTWGGPVSSPLRLFYHHPDLGREFLSRLLSEMEITPSRDARQITDWLAAGKYSLSLFTTPSRTGLYFAREQGLPVAWFGSRAFKEGAILGAASGNIMLLKKAPHPNTARLFINWFLSRDGQLVYQKVFGGDSRRTDISKENVAPERRRLEGVKYIDTDSAEMIDMREIFKFVKEVYKPKHQQD